MPARLEQVGEPGQELVSAGSGRAGETGRSRVLARLGRAGEMMVSEHRHGITRRAPRRG
jgi:hypothetical protein